MGTNFFRSRACMREWARARSMQANEEVGTREVKGMHERVGESEVDASEGTERGRRSYMRE